jgi:DNA uptake protein ComE-like DNA-binding protein
MRYFFYMPKSDRIVLMALGAVLVIIFGAIYLTGQGIDETNPLTAEDSLLMAETKDRRTHTPKHQPYYQQSAVTAERFTFDPNTADSTELLRLGLQPWQVRNIYKYRAAGGIYRRPKDFAKLYGLTVKQYRELEPYIRISADYSPAATLVADEKPHQRDTMHYPVKISETEHVVLNTADTAALLHVPGIGSYYAKEIVKYGKWLGGYVSVDQLDEIDHFPAAAKKFFVIENPSPHKLNVNRLSLNELKRHPYINFYQAKAITEYRRLHGSIKSLYDLRLSKDFPTEAIERLLPYIEY